jgi:pimeloyl-ACP methyl ester carboxylesterase
MSVVLLEDSIIHYEVLGRGRPVIFLHGWVGSWRYWVPAMQSAATSYRSYAIDLWGFGDTAHDLSRYGLEQQVNLIDRFFQEMGILKVALVGHGLGALTALLFAKRFPDLVDRMMLIGCPLTLHATQGRLRNGLPSDLADWLLSKDPVTEPARMDAVKADQQAIVKSFYIFDMTDIAAIIKEMRTPCLLVNGQNDPAVAAPDSNLLALLPARVHQMVLEESGHFPMLDEAVRFNRLLADFLALESGESPRQLQLKEEWKRRVR